MNHRITEIRGIMSIINSSKDFFIRRANLNYFRLVCFTLSLLFVAVIATESAVGIVKASYIEHYNIINLSSSVFFIGIVLSLLIIACFLVTLTLYKKIIINEFQSLLFASAMTQGSLFFVILDKNMNILYKDYNSVAIIGDSINCDNFLHKILKQEDKIEYIKKCIKNEEDTSVKHLMEINGLPNDLEIHLTSLKRPNGFFSLKALPVNKKDD